MSDVPFEVRDDTVLFRLHPTERRGLELLLDDLERILAEEDGEDPALARLLPEPAPTEPQRSEELARLIRAGLLDDRRDRLRDLRTILGRAEEDGERLAIALVDDEPWLLLGVLNDLRLVIGARIGIEALDREWLTADDERRRALAALDHFGWWQWHLVAVIDPESAAAERVADAQEPADGESDLPG